MALPGAREVCAPRGTEISTKSWQTEAPLRMLMNNLDPEVAERPDDLVVYGGTGRACRSWAAFDAIVASLRDLEPDETLLVQSGKPVGILRTHEWAPRVLIANSNLVPDWATWEEFRRARGGGPHDVWPDDRRLVDLHRARRASCRARTRPSTPSPASSARPVACPRPTASRPWPAPSPSPAGAAAWAGPSRWR
jgi:hypothetical protein